MALPEWSDAACRGQDPNLFFPDQGHPAEQAKAICARCPHLVECRDYAISDPHLRGIWGGLSQRERLHLRRSKYVT